MILGGVLPDTDFILQVVVGNFTILGHSSTHGDFHTLLLILVMPTILAYLFNKELNIPKWDTFLFVCGGMIVHVFCDALVYEQSYKLLSPFSMLEFGIGWPQKYAPTFLGMFNPQVMAVGLGLMCLAVMIRCRLEGIGWLDTIIADTLYHIRETKHQIISAKEMKNTKDLLIIGITVVLLISVGCIYYTNTVACNRSIVEGTFFGDQSTIVQSEPYVDNSTSGSNASIKELTDHIVRIRTYSNTTKEYVISNTTIQYDNKTIPEINVTLMKNIQVVDYKPKIDHIYLLNASKEYIITINNISHPLKTGIITYNSSVPLKYPNATDYRVDV
jgi:hypothetical protein